MGKLVSLSVAVAISLVGSWGCDDGDGNQLVPDGSGLLDLPVVHNDASGDMAPEAGLDGDASVTKEASDTAQPPVDVVPEVAQEVAQEVIAEVTSETDGSGGPTVFGGGVYLAEVDSEFINTAVAGARFTALTPEPTPDQVFGPCSVSFQDPDSPTPEGFGYDAGSITIAATTPTVILNPTVEGANGTGYESNLSSTQENLLPAGGAIMSIAIAGGADIGAANVTVQAPEQVVLIAPDVGGFSGGNASTSSPLTVAWGSGNGDQVVVTISPLTNDLQPEPKSGDAIACVLTADAGSVTIPVGALAAVGDGKYALGVTRVKIGSGLDPQGNSVSGTVTRSTGGLLNLN